MLNNIDLSNQLAKTTYKRLMPELSERLYELQKASWDAGIPVIILFEGWDAAGKGTTIQRLARPLDPRGYKVYPIQAARPYEMKRPWLWRFWSKLPARGDWAIFDRSWYGRVMVERIEKLAPEREWRRAYRDIIEFERTLIDDGYLILKFFLHISKDEQRRRFNKLSKNRNSAWHVTEDDWVHHRHYDDWLRAYEEAFERTDIERCPWRLIGANNRRYTRFTVCQQVVSALSDRLKREFIPFPIDEQPHEEYAEPPENEASELSSEPQVFLETMDHPLESETATETELLVE